MYEFDFLSRVCWILLWIHVHFLWNLVKYWDECPNTKLQIVSFTVWLIILPSMMWCMVSTVSMVFIGLVGDGQMMPMLRSLWRSSRCGVLRNAVSELVSKHQCLLTDDVPSFEHHRCFAWHLIDSKCFGAFHSFISFSLRVIRGISLHSEWMKAWQSLTQLSGLMPLYQVHHYNTKLGCEEMEIWGGRVFWQVSW